MTVGMDTGNVSVENVTKESQVAGSVRFDWAVIAVSTWLVLGGYINRSPRLKPGDFPRPSPIQVPASSARGFPDCHPGLLLPGLHRQ